MQDTIQKLKTDLAFTFLIISLAGFALGYMTASSEPEKAREAAGIQTIVECDTDQDCYEKNGCIEGGYLDCEKFEQEVK